MKNWYILSVLERKNKTPFIIEHTKIDTLIVIDTLTESARFICSRNRFAQKCDLVFSNRHGSFNFNLFKTILISFY